MLAIEMRHEAVRAAQVQELQAAQVAERILENRDHLGRLELTALGVVHLGGMGFREAPLVLHPPLG